MQTGETAVVACGPSLQTWIAKLLCDALLGFKQQRRANNRNDVTSSHSELGHGLPWPQHFVVLQVGASSKIPGSVWHAECIEISH